jgi:hypothetical protein
VTDRMERGRLAAENTRLRQTLAREGRLMFVGAVAILLIGGGIGTFLFFRHLAYGELVAVRAQIEQLRTEDQNHKHQLADQNVKISKLEHELKNTQDTLRAIMPSENTYSVAPNQSVIVGGRLTVGLVGSPANENITLSLNGKQQTVLAGQPITDPSTNCQVVVQSFDMFKALINASCAPAKPQ